VECDNCYIFCSDMAVKKDADLETHYYILDQYCKGCGLCVTECPRGAVTMKVEER
jgi:pyruvate ferredoxin oxidoreductase delta subunit